MSHTVQIRAKVTTYGGEEPINEPVQGADLNVPDAPDADGALKAAVYEYNVALNGDGTEEVAQALLKALDTAMTLRVRLMRVALAGAPATLQAVEVQFAKLAEEVGIVGFRP